jgi:putative chitinase
VDLKQKLSEHFTLEELTRTSTGLKNIPSTGEITHLKRLCAVCLEPLREYLKVPMLINSGFRSRAVNIAVGGSRTSDHPNGDAVDFRTATHSSIKLWKLIITSGILFKQVILEHDKINCVHLSCGDDRANKCQILVRWKGSDGYIKYKTLTRNQALNYDGDYSKFTT